LAGSLASILTFSCWVVKILEYGANLPIIILINVANTFYYVCAFDYGMGIGFIMPLALTLLFLILLLIPDDIISFGFGMLLSYLLGTTAPLTGTVSVLAGMGGAIGGLVANANLLFLGGALEIGPKAIFWLIFLLAVKETFFPQGVLTVPFVSYVKKGEDIIPKQSQMNLKYGSEISQLRHVVAEGVFVVLGAMWVECHWNLPIYTIILGIIDQIIGLLQMVGGAI
jgi:hypothetical protein